MRSFDTPIIEKTCKKVEYHTRKEVILIAIFKARNAYENTVEQLREVFCMII